MTEETSTNKPDLLDTDESSSGFNKILMIEDIQKLLPHRYPFLLVDRIIDFVPNKYATGIKNVTINEQFFQGHFPEHPIMPGVLIVEAMAQVGGIVLRHLPGMEDQLSLFAGIDKVRFRNIRKDIKHAKIKTSRIKHTFGIQLKRAVPIVLGEQNLSGLILSAFKHAKNKCHPVTRTL